MFPNSRPQIAGDRLVECQRAKRRLTLTFLQKLDFENPNEQNFILLVVATEEQTEQRLSSSATLRVQVDISGTLFSSQSSQSVEQVTDLNDNHPVFEKESYTAIIPEEATPGEKSQSNKRW